jgi:hypothetical protein
VLAFSIVFLKGIVSPAPAQVIGSNLERTFHNPTPESLMEEFGWAVTFLDGERVVITADKDNTFAYVSGAAYLFNTNGSLLTTFTNPIPTYGFGSSVATIGSDKILLGAPNSESVYLFDTNGTVLSVFTNPVPASPGIPRSYGFSVAPIGDSLVAINATSYGTLNSPMVGAVFLHTLDSTLVTTITNPNSNAFLEFFGSSISAIGTGQLLVGARGAEVSGAREVGIGYLMSTNGTVISTFTNPSPHEDDSFGRKMLPLGADRVLISAIGKTNYTGAVYLFSTNGTLLSTLLSPDPAPGEHFGSSLAVMENLIVIGAPTDTPEGTFASPQTGTVYIFNTNGTLLRRILNPVPNSWDHFGNSLATFGTNKILIGASEKIVGSYAPGAAYLYNLSPLPPPKLNIEQLNGGSARVFWPYSSTGFVLERSEGSVSSTNAWSLVPPPYEESFIYSNGIYYRFNSATASTTNNAFYRLRQP